MNQTTIVLSKEALDALFPVGTEARIQFATSAVKAFCEQQIKPTQVGKDLEVLVARHRKDVVADVLVKLGAIHTHQGIAFTDAFKAKLRAAAEEQMNAVMKEAVKEAAHGAVQTAQAQASVHVKDQMRLEANKAVREAIGQAVAAALTVAPK
jgi:hypothetical protein